MLIRFVHQTAFFVAALIIISLCLVDSSAQRRRKRPSPRITNPVIAPPGSQTNPSAGEEKIISTAGENGAEADLSAESSKSSSKRPQSDQDQMRQTIMTLANQVTILSEKLSQMQEQQRALVDMERLTRAEQRAETLRAQLRDVQAKEAELQSKLEQIEYALKPENIDRVVSMYGTTHPEEARETRRRQLENERSRTQTQLDGLVNSRVRLESAIATADAEVDLLRQRLETVNPAPGQPSATTVTVESNPTPEEAPPAKNPYPPR
jgi:chromosome segregation ATPase